MDTIKDIFDHNNTFDLFNFSNEINQIFKTHLQNLDATSIHDQFYKI